MRLFHDLHRRRGHPRVRGQIAQIHINKDRENEKSACKKNLYYLKTKLFSLLYDIHIVF